MPKGSTRLSSEAALRPARVRLDEVAAAAGVSPITVSRTLRHPNLVAEPTREAVRRAMLELNYIPDLVAGSLASRRSGEIAIVVPSLNSPAFMGTVRGISEHLLAEGYNFVLGDSNLSGEDEARILASLLGRRADAIILADVVYSTAGQAMLRRSGIPVVETWTLTDAPLDMNVGFDNRAAAAAATAHLIEIGRRHIGMLCGPLSANARGRQRRNGFYDAMAAAGLSAHAFAELPVPIRLTDVGPGLRRLKQLEPALDAIFCSGDTFAVGALFEAQRQGWRVPDDLAVVGLGDSEFADCVVPSLTSVRVDGYRMGRQAAEMITKRLRGERIDERVVDIGFHLRIGGSSVALAPI
jgi:LacI family gluconate utilization system Gnt-I transcriptional repressor